MHWLTWQSVAVRRPAWAGYLWAAGATALSVALYVAILPLVGERTVYLIFLPAAVIGGLMGGAGPALLATLVGMACVWALGGQATFAGAANQLDSLLFIISGLAIAAAGHHLQQRPTA